MLKHECISKTLVNRFQSQVQEQAAHQSLAVMVQNQIPDNTLQNTVHTMDESSIPPSFHQSHVQNRFQTTPLPEVSISDCRRLQEQHLLNSELEIIPSFQESAVKMDHSADDRDRRHRRSRSRCVSRVNMSFGVLDERCSDGVNCPGVLSRSPQRSSTSRSRRSRSGSRSHRSRYHPTQSRSKERQTRSEERREREKERERRQKGLPSIRKEHVSGEHTFSFWCFLVFNFPQHIYGWMTHWSFSDFLCTVLLLSVCSTTLWIGQLDKKTQKQDIMSLMEEFGQVESINVRINVDLDVWSGFVGSDW